MRGAYGSSHLTSRPFALTLPFEGLNEAAMKETYLSMHPNAELVIIPNCGHYPMQECPPFFATVIENFIHKQVG